MTVHTPPRLAAVLAVLALAGLARAEVKDAAELLPAQTLASVEVRQPERLAREVAALTKGSDLDDMPSVMARFREKMGDSTPWFFNETAMMALLMSPEMINECGRVQGGIVGVTGVHKDGPEVVGVILAGDSNFPTFYMRAMLTADFNVRGADEAEGVRIFRERRQNFQPAPPGQPQPPPTWEDSGPFMALLPGTIVLGSSAEGVKDVIHRYKGKSSGPSLASVAAYKEAARLRDKPGLFAYSDLAALAQAMESAGATLGPMEREWRLLKAVVNPKAVRGATASLTLLNGALDLKARIDLDPREPSPLADMLTAKAAPPDALSFTPRDGMLTLALNLNDGEKRWQKLLDLIDALDKPQPGEAERPAPSATLREVENKAKLSLGKDVFGRLTGVALVLDPTAAAKPDRRPVPLLVLQTADADATKALADDGLPKLLGLAALLSGAPEEAPAVVHQDVGGRPLNMIKAVGVGPVLNAKNLYVGREGAFVAVGVDGPQVAAALDAGAKKTGLAADEKAAAALKDLGDATAVSVFSLGRGVIEAFRANELSNPVPTFQAPNPPGAPAPAPPPAPKLSRRGEQTLADVAKAVEPLPPTVLGVSRSPDALTLEVRQTGIKGVSQKVIDLWIESTLAHILEQQKPAGN